MQKRWINCSSKRRGSSPSLILSFIYPVFEAFPNVLRFFFQKCYEEFIYLQIIWHEIDGKFHQLNQNVTTDCSFDHTYILHQFFLNSYLHKNKVHWLCRESFYFITHASKVKFSFSEATKIWSYLPLVLTFTQ